MGLLGGWAFSYERGTPVRDLSVKVLLNPQGLLNPRRDWSVVAEQPAPAPHLAHPEGCAALHLRIVLVTVHRVSRSCEHFPDGFDLPLLQGGEGLTASRHVRIDREGVRDTDDPESMRVGQVPPAWSKVPSALSVERASKKAEYEEEVCSQDW